MPNTYEVIEKESDVAKSAEVNQETKDLGIDAAFRLEGPQDNDFIAALSLFLDWVKNKLHLN